MKTNNPNCLTITISTTDPNEKRLWLIKALAAALRWKANCKNIKEKDEEHQEEISELIEALATDK